MRIHDDWTVERWRAEPQWKALRFEETIEPNAAEQTPPLWKDVTCASVVALLLWLAAVALLR